jgi:predicted component of type VI protein secretion system
VARQTEQSTQLVPAAAVSRARSEASCFTTLIEKELAAELVVLMHWLARSAAAISLRYHWPYSPAFILASRYWLQAPFAPLLHPIPRDGTISFLRKSTSK